MAAPRATLERELKFQSDRPLDLARLGGRAIDERVFTSTYYDTPGGRLLRHGITVRCRVEDDTPLWQLKIPSGDGRLELEDDGQSEVLAPSLASYLRSVLRGESLEPVATLVTHRRGRRIEGVDVTLDEVDVRDGTRTVDRFTEIEAELVTGTTRALEQVAERLHRLGAKRTDGKPKLARVVGPPASPPRPSSGTIGLLKAFVHEQLGELERHDPAIRAGNDPEDIHKMRVAVRRLRSLLRTARPMLDERWVDSLRADLDWLGKRLGRVRDLDVLLDRLQSEAATLSGGDAATAAALLRPLTVERANVRDRLIRSLDEARYRSILDTLDAATVQIPAGGADRTPVRLAAKEYRKLLKRGALSESMSSATLHKRRIRIKRARYAAELAAPSTGKRTRRFVEAAKDLQDILGAHQDAVVARRRLRDLGRHAETRSAAVVAGRLIERQELQIRAARAQVPAAWKRLRRRGKRAWAR